MEVSGNGHFRLSPAPNRQEPLPCEFAGPGRRLSRMSGDATILMAEDDADVLRAARIALAPHAARVETVSTVDGLDQILGSAPFDVVLLDMNFVSGERSGGDGLNALARTQAFDPCLAVVLMTAHGGVALALEALKRGAADFILTPWRNDKLISAVTPAPPIPRSPPPNSTRPLA